MGSDRIFVSIKRNVKFAYISMGENYNNVFIFSQSSMHSVFVFWNIGARLIVLLKYFKFQIQAVILTVVKIKEVMQTMKMTKNLKWTQMIVNQTLTMEMMRTSMTFTSNCQKMHQICDDKPALRIFNFTQTRTNMGR